MVLTSRVLVVACFDRYLVISVRLTSRLIPADVVLAVLVRPGWYLHSLHTFRAVDIFDDDVKGSCILVVVLDQDCTRAAGLTHFCRSFCNIASLVILIYIVDMDIVLPILIFMIACLNRCTVAAVTLTDCFVPY